MSGRFLPHRRFRSELASLSLAVIVPLFLFFAFPRESLLPLPRLPESDRESPYAFVSLTAAEEQRALACARAAWQLDRGATRRMSIGLFAESLPPMALRAVLGLSAISREDRSAPAPYAPDPLPPTLAAPPPAKIAPQPDADAIVPAFSREELLKLN